MKNAVILGCGYTGRVLARDLLAAGYRVRGTTTRPEGRSTVEAVGAEAVVARLDDIDALRQAIDGADIIFHLAPPPREGPLEREMVALQAVVPPGLSAFVYGSTTGVFGAHAGHPWIDEDTVSGEVGARGQKRAEYEAGLARFVKNLRVVRIAGIYGPGRTIWTSLQRPGFVLFEGGPPTSRIHVEDLARLLAAMSRPDAPALAVGCDELPAPTLDVARFACDLMKVPCPAPMSLDEARSTLSPAALEMRLGGRRCRSKVRPSLIGELRYPTYETGLVAALTEEGRLSRG